MALTIKALQLVARIRGMKSPTNQNYNPCLAEALYVVKKFGQWAKNAKNLRKRWLEA